MTPPLKVEFCFDFGIPNAYLADLLIPAIERRTGVIFESVPVLLGGIYKATCNVSFSEAPRGIKNKPEYRALETERFIRLYNINTHRQDPYFSVNTLMLMRGPVAAQFERVFAAYFCAAFHHNLELPKKVDEIGVFRSAFTASGINIDRLMARARQNEVKARPIELTHDAVARGASVARPFLSARTYSSARTGHEMWKIKSTRCNARDLSRPGEAGKHDIRLAQKKGEYYARTTQGG